MSVHYRILIASHRPRLDWAAHCRAAESGRWQIIGVVNPRLWAHSEPFEPRADILLIEADDLIWLLDHKPRTWLKLANRMRPLIMLDAQNILDIGIRGELDWGILLRRSADSLPLQHLPVAMENHVVLSAHQLQTLQRDGLRLDIARALSLQEREVMSLLGTTFSNRALGFRTGMSEAKIKAIIYQLSRKLRLRNRTAVAVFAVRNGFAQTA